MRRNSMMAWIWNFFQNMATMIGLEHLLRANSKKQRGISRIYESCFLHGNESEIVPLSEDLEIGSSHKRGTSTSSTRSGASSSNSSRSRTGPEYPLTPINLPNRRRPPPIDVCARVYPMPVNPVYKTPPGHKQFCWMLRSQVFFQRPQEYDNRINSRDAQSLAVRNPGIAALKQGDAETSKACLQRCKDQSMEEKSSAMLGVSQGLMHAIR